MIGLGTCCLGDDDVLRRQIAIFEKAFRQCPKSIGAYRNHGLYGMSLSRLSDCPIILQVQLQISNVDRGVLRHCSPLWRPMALFLSVTPLTQSESNRIFWTALLFRRNSYSSPVGDSWLVNRWRHPSALCRPRHRCNQRLPAARPASPGCRRHRKQILQSKGIGPMPIRAVDRGSDKASRVTVRTVVRYPVLVVAQVDGSDAASGHAPSVAPDVVGVGFVRAGGCRRTPVQLVVLVSSPPCRAANVLRLRDASHSGPKHFA